MSVARLTACKMRLTRLEYLIKALDSYGKLIMGLKAVYALVAFVYFCARIFNFFSLKTINDKACPSILLHFCHWRLLNISYMQVDLFQRICLQSGVGYYRVKSHQVQVRSDAAVALLRNFFWAPLENFRPPPPPPPLEQKNVHKHEPDIPVIIKLSNRNI